MSACSDAGRPPRKSVGEPTARVKELASLGKPLVGRVVGEMLTSEEVERMPALLMRHPDGFAVGM